MQYKNPVISGFYPDPSVCRVGDTYYLVNSSFEYFPGIPIFESKDLIHWHQIGHVIDKNNPLLLKRGFPNKTGLYAPTIRYHKGRFYVVCTNVAFGDEDEGNFIVSAENPAGPWSNPIFLDLPGIDPSLLFDADGSVYFTGTHGNIYVCKIDIETGKTLENRRDIWAGTGGSAPEGPHLYHIDDWYYLMISEGGTEMCHMVTMSRSRSPYGPYESFSGNPIMSNRSTELPIRAAGHADLVCDTFGKWWAVCLGVRVISYPLRHNLGRETMLLPVEWHDGWPIMGREGFLDELIVIDRHMGVETHQNASIESQPFRTDFTKAYDQLPWNSIYTIDETLIKQTGEGLQLLGNSVSLSEASHLAWYGRRQTHHVCSAAVNFEFAPMKDGEEVGLTVYMNHQHHYEIAMTQLEGKRHLIFRRQIGALYRIENMVAFEHSQATFKVEADKSQYRFSYQNHADWVEFGCGETQYLTTEVGGCFTGNYIGFYATGNGSNFEKPATIKWFEINSENA